MAERQESGKNFVYRAYDSSGSLLYVGLTKNLERRIRQHIWDGSKWIHQVAALTAEVHATRRAAAIAELAAIRGEHPMFNLAGTPRPPRPIVSIAELLAESDRLFVPTEFREVSPEERERRFQQSFTEYVRLCRLATKATRGATS